MEEKMELDRKVPLKQDIDYIFLFKGYTIMVLKNGTNEVVDLPLCTMEQLLTDLPFFRIHRSFLVNLRRVRELEIQKDKLLIRMRGHELPVARRRRKQLLQLLGTVN